MPNILISKWMILYFSYSQLFFLKFVFGFKIVSKKFWVNTNTCKQNQIWSKDENNNKKCFRVFHYNFNLRKSRCLRRTEKLLKSLVPQLDHKRPSRVQRWSTRPQNPIVKLRDYAVIFNENNYEYIFFLFLIYLFPLLFFLVLISIRQ